MFEGVRGLLVKWLGIVPATSQQQIVIREYTTREAEVLKNKVWYRGDPSEIEQYYKLASDMGDVFSTVPSTRFWASVPEDGLIRKLHTGLPRLIVDKLAGIVVEDMNEPEMDGAVRARWEEIAEDTGFEGLLREAVKKVLAEGDGAFKFSVDTSISQYPLIEFYSGNEVDFKYKRGKLTEVVFYTDHWKGTKLYTLVETYGKGYVTYSAMDANKQQVDVAVIDDKLQNVTFDGDFIMAVPLKFYPSAKWIDRGDAIYEGKADLFDALDECISTWIDALRGGRVKQYIPETLIPRDPETGSLRKPDVFNSYHILNAALQEDAKNEVSVKQGAIDYEGFLATYITLLDAVLQGIISPSTLGIDVKKLDNAESQREKEKTTLYTRDTIIGVLSKVLPRVVDTALKVDDVLHKVIPQEYDAEFEWGQYANPSFEAMVETIGKAKQYGIMSLEKCIDELYGDTMDEESKAKELERLKTEVQVDEPYLGDDISVL